MHMERHVFGNEGITWDKRTGDRKRVHCESAGGVGGEKMGVR